MLAANCIGTGEPLLLLHGLFGDKQNLGNVARTLAPRFCCHCLDLPNHGDSPRLEDMRFNSMLPLLADYIAALPAPVNLLGHSLGGKLAMLYACRNAGRVRHLIIADIAPKQNAARMSALLAALKAVDLQGTRQQAEQQLTPAVPDRGVRGFLLKSLRRTPTGFCWRFNLESISNHPDQWLANSLADGDRYPALCDFIYGEQSDYVDAAGRAAIQKHFPRARLHPIADAGHWLHSEQPVAFNMLVENILTGQ